MAVANLGFIAERVELLLQVSHVVVKVLKEDIVCTFGLYAYDLSNKKYYIFRGLVEEHSRSRKYR